MQRLSSDISLEKYGKTSSRVRHLVVMQRKCCYKSDAIRIRVIFCNSWVSAGKPLLLYNLMSGHHWKLDSYWSWPSLPASDWLVSGHLIPVTPSCHHKLLPARLPGTQSEKYNQLSRVRAGLATTIIRYSLLYSASTVKERRKKKKSIHDITLPPPAKN